MADWKYLRTDRETGIEFVRREEAEAALTKSQMCNEALTLEIEDLQAKLAAAEGRACYHKRETVLACAGGEFGECKVKSCADCEYSVCARITSLEAKIKEIEEDYDELKTEDCLRIASLEAEVEKLTGYIALLKAEKPARPADLEGTAAAIRHARPTRPPEDWSRRRSPLGAVAQAHAEGRAHEYGCVRKARRRKA